MSKEKKDKFIIIRVSSRLRKLINTLAKTEHKSISDFIREILEKIDAKN